MTTAEMFQRQNRIISPDDAGKVNVTICGCGTVGSNAAIQLAKIGIKKFDLWDMDTVEIHNLPSQHFYTEQISDAKTEALGETLRSFSPDVDISAGAELKGYEQFVSGAVILAVDSMDMRKTIFQSSIKTDPFIDFVIDMRMGGPTLQAWAFDPRDAEWVEKYEASLYSSAESVPMPCGTSTFAPVGALAGAVAAQLMTSHIAGGKMPFYTQINLAEFGIVTTGMRDRVIEHV